MTINFDTYIIIKNNLSVQEVLLMYNQKNACLVLAICLCIFFGDVVTADYPSYINISEKKANLSVGEPSYEIYSYTKYLETNKNKDIKIEYFLTGVGQVNSNKIRISIPPNICKDANVYYQTIEGNWSEIGAGQFTGKHETHLYPSEGAQLGGWLPSFYFTVDKEDTLFNYGGKPWQSVNDTISVVSYSNSKASVIAPVTVNFTIARDAPAGNHEVLFFVFYEHDNVWYSSQESVTVHVNHIYEHFWVKVGGIFVGFLTICSILSTGYSNISNYKKDKNTNKSKNNDKEINKQKGKRK